MPHTFTADEVKLQFIETVSARKHRLYMTQAPQSAVRLVEEIPPDAEAGETAEFHCIVVLNDGVESYITGDVDEFFKATADAINRSQTFANQLGKEQFEEMQKAQNAQAAVVNGSGKGKLVLPR